ncbi:MAG: hypothetical protein AB7V46_11270, partial [Thermomicrobiales bacterium]
MPTLAEFDDAMLRPGRYVPAIRRLGGGTLIARGEGQPFRITGNDAVIYKLHNPSFGAIALRAFLDDDLAEQTAGVYRALAEPTVLRRFNSMTNSPLVQRLAWYSDGITLRGDQLRSMSTPLVATEWIDGPTVFRAAEHAARARDGHALASLAEGWRRAIAALGQMQFAHGSLSPDNALLDLHRGVVLVDYDHAWWPGLPLRSPHSIGLTHYRHKQAASATPWQVDGFAALVVYVSLRALSANPALRDRYGQPSVVRDGSLLFDQRDLEAPKRSELFSELEVVEDLEIRALATVLRQACEHGLDHLPTIEEAVLSARSARDQTNQRKPPKPQHTSTETRSEMPSLDYPPTAAPPDADAARGVSPVTRAALDRAIAAGDAASVTRLWPQLAGDAESSWQAIPANELIQRFVVAGLDDALNNGQPKAITEAVTVARSLGVPLSTEQVRAGRRARLALNLRAQVDAAVASDDREALAELSTIESALPLT